VPKSIDGFGQSTAIPGRLARAAGVAMGEVLGAKKGERVLIITNPNDEVRRISMALYDAAGDRGARPTLVFQPPKNQLDFAEDTVIEALKAEPEIIISISHHKLGKDRSGMKKNYSHKRKTVDHIFNYLIMSKRSRSFWSPSVTIAMFEKTVPIDYGRLRENAKRLKQLFDKAVAVHLTTRLGTDIMLGLRGRKAFTDDGDFSKPGAGGNLPAGEMFVSPELGSGEGTLAFDGCISSDMGVIMIKQPIRVTVKGNLVTRIAGGREARLLRETLSRARKTTRRFGAEGRISKRDLPAYLRNIANLGELGIGLNERASIVGNMLEDEKVAKTCHIAIGSNYDEDAKALIHLDGLVTNPTMNLIDKGGRRRPVMRNGSLVI
jgi:aminopeptidase